MADGTAEDGVGVAEAGVADGTEEDGVAEAGDGGKIRCSTNILNSTAQFPMLYVYPRDP